LGGGVVGDIAGFVAATYKRGVPLVHIPTTLLAQVDSSIGGKVALNHGRLKNIIGTFYHPEFVVSDTTTLGTLPAKEIRNGLAEVIKYAVIRDKSLFVYLEKNLGNISQDTEFFEKIVFRCAKIKARIVKKDEKDWGLRNILNYGHTIGHAIEASSEFDIPHGEAVALGMVVEATVSNRLGMLAWKELTRIKRLIEKAGLPLSLASLDTEKIIEAMKNDKKVAGGKVRFILPDAIGKVVIKDDVSLSLVREILQDVEA
jgi:3-dehydroquinate synthase